MKKYRITLSVLVPGVFCSDCAQKILVGLMRAVKKWRIVVVKGEFLEVEDVFQFAVDPKGAK